MISIAEQKQTNCYHTSAYAALRAFEELIDAFSSKEDLHFHTLYSEHAWKERCRWMESNKNKINLMHEWNNMVYWYSSICSGDVNSQKCLEKMIETVKYYLMLLNP